MAGLTEVGLVPWMKTRLIIADSNGERHNAISEPVNVDQMCEL